MKNVKVIPEIRFREFEGEWNSTNLGKASTFLDSQRIPLSQSERSKRHGLYPYYGASGVIDYVDDFLFDEELVLLGEDGANILNRSTKLAYCVKGKIWVNNHAHVIRAKGSNFFLAEILEKIDYAGYNTGTVQPKLNSAECKKIKINLPSLPEQQKIATFLSLVDRRLAAARRRVAGLEEWKRGVVQQVIRDSQRARSWNKVPIGILFSERKEKGRLGLQLLSVTLRNGVTLQSESNKDDTSNSDKSKYRVVEKGDIAYNSMRMWQGASGVSEYEGLVSPAYTVMIPSCKVNVRFYGYLFKMRDMIFIFQRNSQGLTSDTWNLKFKALSKIKVPFPPKTEQDQIIAILTNIDARITAAEREVAGWEAWKKGLLQKMLV